ncbi:NIPSNAP family protein [Reinekea marina]|uniref:NIPSNAP family protein n=1 Tax=Reinekea marina TaxID=1310421 RepID=A0ABV7WWE0_9GAMM
MFYRRKYYIVANQYLDEFNKLFNEVNLPNQLKHGTRIVGRWMLPLDENRVEVFAIWEYDSKDEYERIEANIRSDETHVQRIADWYKSKGGRDIVHRDWFLEVRNEEIYSTVPTLN